MATTMTTFDAIMRAVYAPLRKCPVCGRVFLLKELSAHCREAGDDAHLVLEVMET